MHWKVSRYTHVLPLEDGRGLLYNGYTGAIAELSEHTLREAEDVFRLLERDKAPARRTRLFRDLLAGGFVVKGDLDELALLESRYEAERKDSQFLFTILPTFACNLGCGYCFVGKKSGRMSAEVQDRIAAFAAERMSVCRKDMHVDWFGGEPLLGLDVIERLSERLIALCAENGVGYRAQVISNGTVIDERTVQVLKRAAVDRIQVSLDGLAEIHDTRRPFKRKGQSSFAATMANLEQLIGSFVVRLRINIDARNIDDAWLLLDEFERRGWIGAEKEFYPYLARVSAFTDACSSVAPLMCSLDDFYRAQFAWLERLERRGVTIGHHGLYELPEPKAYNCGAVGENGFVFTPEGDIHKCGLEVDNSSRAIGRLGTALDAENGNAVRFSRYSPFEREMCRGCEFLPSCLGGCPRDHLEGHEREIKDNCRFHKEFENKLLLFHLGHRTGLPTTWKGDRGSDATQLNAIIPLTLLP